MLESVACNVGDYKVIGAVDDRNLVERTETWLPHPLLGDLTGQWDYTGYEDRGGFMFPSRLHHHAGDILPAVLTELVRPD